MTGTHCNLVVGDLPSFVCRVVCGAPSFVYLSNVCMSDCMVVYASGCLVYFSSDVRSPQLRFSVYNLSLK